jgi:outer membrane protein assembly factor BamB
MVLGCLLVVAALVGATARGLDATDAAPLAPRLQDEEAGLIAFAGTDGNIWVTDPEGRTPRQVTVDGTLERPYTRPRWSPDGRALVFAQGRTGDGVYLARDGIVMQIPAVTGCGYPTFFPDGERLLYACGLGYDREDPPSAEELATDPALGFVSTSRLDGSDWQVLVPYTVDTGEFPTWTFKYGRPPMAFMSDVSPSGTVVLSVMGMAGSTIIWELDVEDATLALLDLPMEDDPSVDGSQVYRDVAPLDRDDGMLAVRCRGACTMGTGADETVIDVVTVHPGTGALNAVLTLPGDTYLATPSFDPFARKLTYQSSYAGQSAVWVAAIPNGTPQVIAAGTDPVWQPVAVAFTAPNISALPSGDVPMYRISASGSGEQPGPAPLDAPVIRWRMPLGGEVPGSPVLADEVLFVAANDGSLHALDPVTGDPRWTAVDDYLRVVTSPAIGGGAVYVTMTGLTSGAGYGNIQAYDRTSGAQLWAFAARGRPVGAPIVHNATVYVGTGDGYLYGLDAGLGTEDWRASVGFAVTASPAIAGDTVVVPRADGVLYAVDATTGAERWQFPTGTVQPLTAATVAGDTVVVGGADGYVYAVDSGTGDKLWQFDTGGPVLGDPISAGGVVYVASDSGSLYAIDAADGAERWHLDVGSPARTTPSATADTVVFSTMDGYLHAVDAGTGTERWRFDTHHYATSPALIAGGNVYFGSGDGYLYAIGDASP